ncbi:MAG: hypothetical protein R2752_06270 [Vicinamibacterales bacterium]
MPDPSSSIEEFTALRATIRERGTLRLFVMAITFVSWTAIFATGWPSRSAAVLPCLASLLLLAAGFEVAFAAHVGAERVGRYIHASFEGTGLEPPRWEHAVLAFGTPAGRAPGLDPLGVSLFSAAALLNLTPVMITTARATPPSFLSIVGAVVAILAHGAFWLRLRQTARFARRQREVDASILAEDLRKAGR